MWRSLKSFGSISLFCYITSLLVFKIVFYAYLNNVFSFFKCTLSFLFFSYVFMVFWLFNFNVGVIDFFNKFIILGFIILVMISFFHNLLIIFQNDFSLFFSLSLFLIEFVLAICFFNY